MKKFIIAALIAALIPATVFAGGFLGLTLGATAAYDGNIQSISEDASGLKDINAWAIGAEARVKVAFVHTNVVCNFAQNEVEEGAPLYQKYTYSGIATVGTQLSLFGLLNVGVGVGTGLAYQPTTNTFVVGGQVVSGDTDVKEMLKNCPLIARATADIAIGDIILGATCTLDTGVTANTINNVTEADVMSAQVGIFCGLSIL